MRISDWSSDVCSSDLDDPGRDLAAPAGQLHLAEESQRLVDRQHHQVGQRPVGDEDVARGGIEARAAAVGAGALADVLRQFLAHCGRFGLPVAALPVRHDALELVLALGARSEEHTSELQTLIRISYAVFCLKKKNNNTNETMKSSNQEDQ